MRAATLGLALALAIAFVAPLAAPGAPAAPPDPAAATLAKVADEAGCASPLKPGFHEEASGLGRERLRRWCAAAEGWAKGIAAELPPSPAVWFGVAVALPVGDVTAPRLSGKAGLTALVVTGEGSERRVSIRAITPDNPDEAALIERTVEGLSPILAGAVGTAAVPGPLAEFARSLATRPTRALTKGPQGWHAAAEGGVLAAELRRVGPWWVTVERDGEKGIWLGVYTDRWAPAR